MHKYFAKPLFLGKMLEFLPECHSTNEEVLLRIRRKVLNEGYILHTGHQIAGKGQRGNAWLSEPGKNLLFSIYLTPKMLLPKQAFLLNIISGLAVVDALYPAISDTVELKWPNDVYVGDRKISGILVETMIEGGVIVDAVVGIGVNVNQSYFSLTSATSMLIESGRPHNLEELLEQIVLQMEKYYLKLKSGDARGLLEAYYKVMRWRGEIHSFQDKEGIFEGEIIGVDDTGRLTVKTNNIVRSFDVKEIAFLY